MRSYLCSQDPIRIIGMLQVFLLMFDRMSMKIQLLATEHLMRTSSCSSRLDREFNPSKISFSTTASRSSSSVSQELSNLQRKGIRTISIGLSSNMTPSALSSFAQNAFMVSDWNSSFTGIDTNYNLADRIYQMTTKKRTPSTSNFFGNLIYVVDQSGNSYADHSNIVQFVSDSVTPFLVGNIK